MKGLLTTVKNSKMTFNGSLGTIICFRLFEETDRLLENDLQIETIQETGWKESPLECILLGDRFKKMPLIEYMR